MCGGKSERVISVVERAKGNGCGGKSERVMGVVERAERS